MLEAAFSALNQLVAPSSLVYLCLGVVAGLVIGMIPGLGGTAAVALLLPTVFILDPFQALALIIGASAVVHTSDTIASVVLGVPGSASAAVLLLDGHEMARRGEAGRALAIAFISSMIGGVIGAIGLTLTIPIARPLVLSFGAPELFMATVLGIAMTALLSGKSMLRGLTAAALGLLLGQVGAAPAAAEYRFTFSSIWLYEGLDLVAVALGVFGVAELIGFITRRNSISGSQQQKLHLRAGTKQGLRDIRKYWRHPLQGSLLGMWAGVLPGIGATAGTWMAYGQARATVSAKERQRFGKGDPRGVMAPEAANNSVEGGDLIPTLIFGIPGAASAAMLLGALLVFGIEPGPSMIESNLDIVYTIVWSLALGSVLGALLCFVLSPQLSRLAFVPLPVVAAGLAVILFASAYQGSRQMPFMVLMLILGAAGWIFKACDIPRAPFLIGFVLSLPLERYFYLTDSLYTFPEWSTRPAVLVMAAVLVCPVIWKLLKRTRTRIRPASAAGDVPPEPAEGPEETTDVQAPVMWRAATMVVISTVFLTAFIVSRGFVVEARLAPTIASVAGFVVALCAAVSDVRTWRRARDTQPVAQAVGGISTSAAVAAPLDDADERSVRQWGAELSDAVRGVAWLAGLIAGIYFLGMLIAAAVFVPLFLRTVARTRRLTAIVYTAAVVLILVLLRDFAGMHLPIGYLTPPGF
ncbi:membrane protein [Mycolicibacterium murale]|uniref:Membrane protein n=1 Tax=Mycolicibacterium murale TaxID=182220 RepID=A0A7I9WG90_9MYCO|nr:tripartite tricarboxylate transporter permease [Mycolicibacterium murale]MCV7183162.1 tripartite tricarboxylate transporter permease [Mycolicibacterium murale]GFG56723.1 membrane protein [Mycolicibacterium murale]